MNEENRKDFIIYIYIYAVEHSWMFLVYMYVTLISQSPAGSCPKVFFSTPSPPTWHQPNHQGQVLLAKVGTGYLLRMSISTDT